MRSGLVAGGRLLLAGIVTLSAPILAGALVGAALAALGAERWPLIAWFAGAPLLYLAWLLTFLVISALEFQLHARLHGPKPRRLTLDERRLTIQAAILVLTYQRLDQVRSLPWTTSMLHLPVLQRLYLLSYAPRTSIGKDVLIYGTIYDPDLIEFGDGAIVGGGAALAAHAFTARQGTSIGYISAPIRLGANATIGGEAQISLGSTIGEGAVIEAGSVVEPNTHVPAFEVWGGSPARFRRSLRETSLEIQPATAAAAVRRSAAAETRDAAHRLVAEALEIPLADLAIDARAEDVPAWDSLGQLVIATLAGERHGVSLDAEDVYRIRSVDDVAALLAGTWIAGPPVEAAHSPVPETDVATGPEVGNPELLPLLDPALATRALAARQHLDPARHQVDVVVSATFTAGPLIPSLRLWARAFGIEVAPHVAGFDQVETDLLSASGAMRVAPVGAVRAVLVRLEDLGPDMAARGARARSILAAIETFAETHGSLVVGSLPPPVEPLDGRDRGEFEAVRGEWSQRLRAIRAVDVADVAGVVERLGVRAAADAAKGASSGMPWSPAACRDLGIEIARSVRRRFVAPAKVVAIDCDGTLWRGIVGEDGASGVGVAADGRDRAFQLLQRRLLDLRERGVLLAIVSRNEESDVWQVFDTHPGMVLRRSDIAAWRIAWRPKSELLAELSTAMGFSLDAFVFVDDDHAVRLEVEANAPGVVVVPLPEEPADRPATLASLWAFDGAGATDVDQARTRLVQDDARRDDARRETTDMATYLRDLGLVVSIHVASPEELPRLAQLTQRTNQFNVSLRRRSADEIAALMRAACVLSLAARDRFGDYGLVGMAIVETGDSAPTLDTFLMSCRALGRGVEEALLHAVATIAAGTGAERILAPAVVGPRNAPALEFLRRHGFVDADPPGVLAAPVPGAFDVPAHITLEMDPAAITAALRPEPAVPAGAG